MYNVTFNLDNSLMSKSDNWYKTMFAFFIDLQIFNINMMIKKNKRGFHCTKLFLDVPFSFLNASDAAKPKTTLNMKHIELMSL